MAEQIINYELTICIDSCRRPYHRFGVHIESRGIRRGNRRCIPPRTATRGACSPARGTRTAHAPPGARARTVTAGSPRPPLQSQFSRHQRPGRTDGAARSCAVVHGRIMAWRGRPVAQHVIGRRRFCVLMAAGISDSASTVLTIAYRALGLPRARHSYSSTLI